MSTAGGEIIHFMTEHVPKKKSYSFDHIINYIHKNP